MNIIKNMPLKNIKVSFRKKILNIILIIILCSGILFSIPFHSTKQIDMESLEIFIHDPVPQNEKIIPETTTDLITTEEEDFEVWYAKLLEKQELRKEKHQKTLEVCGVVSGTILVLDGIAMVHSQMPWILSSTYGLVAPGIIIVGAELIVIGTGIIMVSLYFSGGDSENNVEEVH